MQEHGLCSLDCMHVNTATSPNVHKNLLLPQKCFAKNIHKENKLSEAIKLDRALSFTDPSVIHCLANLHPVLSARCQHSQICVCVCVCVFFWDGVIVCVYVCVFLWDGVILCVCVCVFWDVVILCMCVCYSLVCVDFVCVCVCVCVSVCVCVCVCVSVCVSLC